MFLLPLFLGIIVPLVVIVIISIILVLESNKLKPIEAEKSIWIRKSLGRPVRVVHISSYHPGTLKDVDQICKRLSHQVTHLKYSGFDVTRNNREAVYKKHKTVVETADVLFFSDVATMFWAFLPYLRDDQLAIVWVCHWIHFNARIFEWKQILNQAGKKPNVIIIPWRVNVAQDAVSHGFQHLRPVIWSSVSIKEDMIKHQKEMFSVPKIFIGHYPGTELMAKEFKARGVPFVRKTYYKEGPIGCLRYKLIANVPFHKGSCGFAENVSVGAVYLIPSIKFLKTLGTQRQAPHVANEGDYYDGSNSDACITFESWDEAADIAKSILNNPTALLSRRQRVIRRSNELRKEVMKAWSNVFDEYFVL